MGRSPYDPPRAPVETPPLEGVPARWRWLFVPLGHAALTFIVLVVWWRPVPRPSEVDAIGWAAREALFQGGVLLLLTILLLWVVPRIFVRHAVYVAVASTLSRSFVDLAAFYLSGPRTNNGERLDRTIATYCVVLLLSSVIIRMAGRSVAAMSPNKSPERTREG
jgi:hypothetical protein